MVSSVAIRLGTVGKADVKADFSEIADSGDANAKRLVASYDRASDDIGKAIQRQADAAAKISAIMPSNRQFAIDTSVGTGYDSSRNAGAKQYAALLADQERQAESVRMAIDPMYAAQRRYDDELRIASGLLSQGALSEEEYAAAAKLAQTRLEGLSGAHGRVGASGMIADHVIRSFTDSVVAGQSPVRALAMEIPRITEAMQFMSMGAEGGEGALAKVAAFMSGGWGIAITAGVSALAVLGPELLKAGDDADTMKDHQEALGKIIDQTTGRINEQSKALLLNAAALSQSDAKHAATAAAAARTGILAAGNPTYVQGSPYGGGSEYIAPDPRIASAISAFGKDGDANTLATTLSKVGDTTPKLKATTDAILAQGAAFVTSSRQVAQYDAQVRLLMGAPKPGDQRTAIGQFGPEKPDVSLADAEAKRGAATTARERAEADAQITQIKGKKALDDGTMTLAQYTAAMTKADAAVNAASSHTDKHAATLARDAAAMMAVTRFANEAATAYLNQGAAAGMDADAQGKATSAATKSGADIAAQVSRQLAQNIAESNRTAAAAVSMMRLETSARTQVNASIEAGTIKVDQMGQALGDENALRSATIAQSLALRKGLTDDYNAITVTIDAYKRALQEAHDEESHGNALKALDDLKKQTEDAQLAKQYAGDTSGAYDRAKALLAAGRASDANGDNLTDRQNRETAGLGLVNADQDAKAKAAQAAGIRDAQDSLAISAAQIAMIGKSADAQELVLDTLRQQLTLSKELGDKYSQYAPDWLNADAAAKAAAQEVVRVQGGMEELRSTGGKIIDDLLNPKGNGLKAAFADAREELEKMALIDPLKNLMGGAHTPTIADLFSGGGSGGTGWLSKLFGGGGNGGIDVDGNIAAANGSITSILASLPHFASGTESTPGGLAEVGENGPELLNLPGGTRVSNAADTRRMLQSASNDNRRGDVHVYAQDAVLAGQVREWVRQGMSQAAASGAAGGRSLSRQDAFKSSRRQLGTRR